MDDMEEFAAAAAHDLKAPLRAMQNLAQWMADDPGAKASPELAENLALMLSNIRRMQRLLDDLLAYARIGNAEPLLQLDLKGLLQEVAASIKQRPGIRVELPAEAGGILAPQAALGQALLQLISNAVVHHDKAEGWVRVAVKDTGGAVEISVDDNGPGIDPKQQELIFKLGKTLKPKDEAEGSGVGLALVKRIVKLYGAYLALESSPGKGSRFRLSWPKGVKKP